jgi:tetratricopeptide (TPR) repeat protein
MRFRCEAARPALATLALALAACGRGAQKAPAATGAPGLEASYVGRQTCARCHANEDTLWRGSHHDLAMQLPDATSVLGDFSDASFRYAGVTTRFLERDGRFVVRTDGPDGKLHDYEVAYTFGVTPLQQYLIAFPGGRYQALGVAWDARPAERGGQRWFHLYPSERLTHQDPLHWTGPNQNWNFMCAECHSTNLRKNYRAGEDRYETTFSEIDVACEACHGPGSAHVSWGERVERGDARRNDPQKGLAVRLKDPAGGRWERTPAEATARRSVARGSQAELETCGRCHARRSVVSEQYVHGRPLLDSHRLALLEEGLYFADGQIQDEVYEYGSFAQSRMHRAGVTCSDCHDPHSLRVEPSPDGVCARCHSEQAFAAPAHHFHAQGTSGASCVACHMPARTYMGADPRRDHSLRVPRPDLSLKVGAPDACSGCHKQRSQKWAAQAAARWWPGLSAKPHYGDAILAGRQRRPEAEGKLLALLEDRGMPAIARATAVSLLGRRLSPALVAPLERALADQDPLLRMAAVQALSTLPETERPRLLGPLLLDEVRSVRIDAARALAASPRESLPPEQQAAQERALGEYRQSQAANGERAESHTNLGTLAVDERRLDEAEREYRQALRLDPSFLPAYVNLGDVLRMQGRDEEGERVLEQALGVAPKNAHVHHALGLLLVRRQRLAEALPHLSQAASLELHDARYAYVYAVALKESNQLPRSLTVLRRTHERHPQDRDTLVALASFSREQGDRAAALAWARKLVALSPGDREARGLLRALESETR